MQEMNAFSTNNTNNIKLLYHGTGIVLEKPLFGYGSDYNDYGKGFYTTEDYDKALEWAYLYGRNTPVVNTYELNTEGLNIIDFDTYGDLVLAAELLQNKLVGVDKSDSIFKFTKKYALDLSNADVIIGFRADDSSAEAVKAFASNFINIGELRHLIETGSAGKQVFIKSQKAFDNLKFKSADKFDKDEEKTDLIEKYDRKYRDYADTFLKNRLMQITQEHYYVKGLTLDKTLKADFVYNKETGWSNLKEG